jgi:hypothetical protein
MFIESRLQIILFAPEERNIWSTEEHVSLLRSEAVLIGSVSINISPLCGEDRLLFRTLESGH